jgi:hypothetical protein
MIGVVVASTNVQGIISSFFKGFAGLLTAGK